MMLDAERAAFRTPLAVTVVSATADEEVGMDGGREDVAEGSLATLVDVFAGGALFPSWLVSLVLCKDL